MNQRPQHSVPDYFIKDLKALGWDPDYENMEGSVGCFTRNHQDRQLTIFAQLTVPHPRGMSEYQITPQQGIGTTWFSNVYWKISGGKLKYPSFSIEPETTHFYNPEYTAHFLQEVSDSLLDWSKSLDLRQALQATASIPEGSKYPRNSFAYLAALAILGDSEELQSLKRLVEGNSERPIAASVKTFHLQNAIDCCINPANYALSKTLIAHLREPQQ